MRALRLREAEDAPKDWRMYGIALLLFVLAGYMLYRGIQAT
jgi:hypothetical protein